MSKDKSPKNAVQEGIIPPAPWPLNPERMEGEDFEDYKKRRKLINNVLSLRKHGLYYLPENDF